MKVFFKELFEYNARMNQQLGNILRENTERTSERALKLYSHIVNAHRIWNNRIEPVWPGFGVWDIHTINDCLRIDKENQEHSSQIINNFDPAGIVNQLKIRGKNSPRSVGDILFHIINHSTYHRGQLASEFRENGLEPLATDYILFKSQ